MFGGEGSLRENIILLLSEEFPLSMREIQNRVVSANKSVTYQAVNKVVKQLIESGILDGKDKKYLINDKWIYKLEGFVTNLEEKYLKKGKSSTIVFKGDNIEEHEFDTLIESDKFWNKCLMEWAKSDKIGTPVNCWNGRHCWWVLGQIVSENEYLELYENKGIKLYMISNGKTFLDKYSLKYYVDLGLNAMLNKDSSSKSYYVATFGDNLLEAYYPQEIVKELEEFYKTTKKVSEINLGKYMKIITKKVKVKVRKIYNPELARQVRENIVSKFKRSRK